MLFAHRNAVYKEVLERSKETCDQRYLLSNHQPFFKNDVNSMHLKCIEKCIANDKCKYSFVQNKVDGVKNGKCQLFSDCDVIASSPNSRSGRTFAIVVRTETTTMAGKTTTAMGQVTTKLTPATAVSTTSATTGFNEIKTTAASGNGVC